MVWVLYTTLKNNMNKIILPVIIFLHLLILSKLMFFPYPELFIYPYLTNHGLQPYSQILDQHFPGLMFLPINLDNLGMQNEVDARFWLLGMVLITHIFLFFISSKILKSSSKALLVNLLYLIWQPFFEGWVLWIDSFLPLFLLPAFYALLQRKFFLVGFFLGLGVVFKQTVLPLTFMVLAYIYWKDRNLKNIGKYFLGLGLPIGGMLIYLVGIGVITDFWYWAVIFNLTVYAQLGTQIPTSFGFVSRIFIVYMTSLSALMYKDKNLNLVLGLFLVGSFLGAFDRANFIHFQPSLPFALIASAVGFYSLNKKKYGFILIAVYLFITIWWQSVFYKGHVSNKIFFFDSETKSIAAKIKQYTKPNEKIFVFGGVPHLYQMSQTLPAGNIFVFQFPWFLKVAENRILNGLIQDQPEIIVAEPDIVIEGQQIKDFAPQIYQYIKENYTKIDNYGSVEILKRKD